MNISEFVAEKVAVAKDFRGLSKANPVEFKLTHAGKTFILLCSESEPDTVTVPFNVLWLNADENHPDYLSILRRVDAEKYDDGDYRGTWSLISSVDEMFTEDQYFKNESDVISGEVEVFQPSFASKTRAGGVALSYPSVGDFPIAVGTNDERMSDDREPFDHSHPDTARSMIFGALDKPVFIHGSEPSIGDILAITSDEGDHYLARWNAPSMEFPYFGPVPETMRFVGPNVPVEGNTGHVLRVDVELSDGEILRNVKAVWSVDNTEAASIGLYTGVFRANVVAQTTVVTVTATWTHPDSGQVISETFEITILAVQGLVQLSSISIVGANSFAKGGVETYTVTAIYSDQTSATVTPTTFTSSNSAVGGFVGGVLTTSSSQRGNAVTTLSASYTEGGITRTAQLAVNVTDSTIYPQSLTINGEEIIESDSTETYTVTLIGSNGQPVSNPEVTWSIVSGRATINSSGVVTPNALTAAGNTNVVIRASVTLAGETITKDRTIVIEDVEVWPVSASIGGPATVESGGSGNYTYTVTYSNGSTATKTPNWSASTGSINASGAFTAPTVSSNGSATITATYTEKGVVLNRTKSVSVVAESIVIPPARIGVAKFANRNFTGGVIDSEITQEELEYGVSLTEGLNGTTFDRWDDFADFAESVMTTELNIVSETNSASFTTQLQSDYYIYLMWDSRAGNVEIKDINGFITTWVGVNHRTPHLGNEEGLPEYDPNLSSVREIEYDDGTGLRTWKVIKLESTPLPASSPLSLTYTFKYV